MLSTTYVSDIAYLRAHVAFIEQQFTSTQQQLVSTQQQLAIQLSLTETLRKDLEAQRPICMTSDFISVSLIVSLSGRHEIED